jgi:hypothetical protein
MLKKENDLEFSGRAQVAHASHAETLSSQPLATFARYFVLLETLFHLLRCLFGGVLRLSRT